jgi:endonuclease/exonuclease/phosphatase (EEP) superfamily protein YafD
MSRAAQLLGWILAAPGALLLCRVLGWDAVTPIPQLLAFLPLLPLGLIPLTGLVIWLRAWPTAAIALTVSLVTVAVTWPLPWQRAVPAGPGAAFIVLTANVQRGRATAAAIVLTKRESPDVVFLQECTAECEELLDAEPMKAAYPYRTVTAAGGPEGSALLSRIPLHSFGELAGELKMPSAVVTVEGVDVNLQVAHPMPPIPRLVNSWRAGLGVLADAAAARRGPMVMAGDFNASRDHSGFRHILETGMRDSVSAHSPLGGTWPSALPSFLGVRLDHVLISPEITSVRTRMIDLAGSDHRAVLAQLRIANAP